MNTIISGSDLSWAPDACTLPTVQRPLREAELDSLFASAVKGVTLTPTSTAVFELAPDPAVAAQAAELAARETSCCSFFTFNLTATGGHLSLEVRVPTLHQAVLDALVDQALIRIGGLVR